MADLPSSQEEEYELPPGFRVVPSAPTGTEQETPVEVREVPTPEIDRDKLHRRIRDGFGSDEEARAAMTLYFSDLQGDKEPFDADYDTSSFVHLGKKMSPLAASIQIKKQLDFRAGDLVDGLDSYNAKTDSNKEEEVRAWVKGKVDDAVVESQPWYLKPAVYLATKATHLPGIPDTLATESQSWEAIKEKSTEQYVKKLREESPRRALELADRWMSDTGFAWADRAMLTGKVNLLSFEGLGRLDQELMIGYLRAVKPNFDAETSDDSELWARVKQAGSRSLEGFKATKREIDKVLNQRNTEAITLDAVDNYLNGELDNFVTEDGKFKSPNAREMVGWALAKELKATNPNIRETPTGERVFLMDFTTTGPRAPGTEETGGLLDRVRKLSKERKGFQFKQNLMKLREIKFPTRAEAGRNVISQGFLDALPLAIDMGAAMGAGLATSAAGLGPTGAVLYSVGRFQGNMAEQLVEQGAHPNDASAIAWLASVPYAAIERLQVSQLAPGLKKAAASFLAKGFGKTVATIAKKQLKNTLMEIGEEALQGIIEAAAKKSAKEFADANNITDLQIIKDLETEIIEAARTMPFLTGSSSIVGSVGGAAISQFTAKPGGPADVDLARAIREQVANKPTTQGKGDNFVPPVVRNAYRDLETDTEQLDFLKGLGYRKPKKVQKRLNADKETGKLVTAVLMKKMDTEMTEAATEQFVPVINLDADPESGITVDQAERIVIGMGLQDVTVVETAEDLPDFVRDQFRNRGYVPTDIEGAAGQNRAFIVADNLASPERAEQVVLHEAVGHVGLLRAIGPKNFDALISSIGRDPAIKKVIEQIARDSDREIDLSDESVNREQVEDLLARTAEKNDLDPSAWQKVVATVRTWLRKVGMVNKWTDNDIRVLLSRGKSKVLDADSPTNRVRASLKQSKNVFRNAAIVVADRMIGEVPIDVQVLETELRRKGIEGQTDAIMKYATELAAMYDVAKDADTDPSVINSLREADAVKYNTDLIEMVRAEGVEAGSELAQVAQARVVQLREAATKKRKKRKKERTAKAQEQRAFTPKTDAVKEISSKRLPNILGDKLRDELIPQVVEMTKGLKIPEGKLPKDPTASQLNSNPFMRRIMSRTMATQLELATRKLLAPSEARQSILKDISKLRKDNGLVENTIANAAKLVERIRTHKVRKTRRELQSDIKGVMSRIPKTKIATPTGVFLKSLAVMKNSKPTEAKLRGIVDDSIQRLNTLSDGNESQADLITREAERARQRDRFQASSMLVAIAGRAPSVASMQGFIDTVTGLLAGEIQTFNDVEIAREEKAITERTPVIDAVKSAVGQVKTEAEKSGFRNGIAALGTGMFMAELKLLDAIRFATGATETEARRIIGQDEKRMASATFAQQDTIDTMKARETELLEDIYDTKNTRLLLNELRRHDSQFDRFILPTMGATPSRASMMYLLTLINQDFYRRLAKDTLKDGTPKNPSLAKLLDDEDAIRDALEPADLAYVAAIPEVIKEELSEQEQEQARRLLGVHIDITEPNYFEARFQTTKQGKASSQRSVGLIPPSARPRTRHSRDIDYVQDIFSMYDSHINSVAQFLAFGDMDAEFEKKYFSKEFRGAVGDTYGPDYEGRINKHLTDILVGRASTPDPKIPGFRKAMSFLAWKYLSTNLGSISKQGLGSTALITKYGLTHFLKSGNRTIREFNSPEGKKIRALLREHPAWKKRKGGAFSELSATALDQAASVIPDSWLDFADTKIHPRSAEILHGLTRVMGPGALGTVDAQAALLISSGVVQTIMETDTTISAITDPDARMAAAVDEYMDAVEQTMQSTSRKDLNDWLRSDSETLRAFSQFMSAPQQQAAWEIFHFRQYRADKGPGRKAKKHKFYSAVFVNHVLIPTLFSVSELIVDMGVSLLTGKEDEETLQQRALALGLNMLLGPFGSIIFVGGMFNALGRTAYYTLAEKYFDESFREKHFGRNALPVSKLTSDIGLIAQMFADTVTAPITGDTDQIGTDVKRLIRSFPSLRILLELLEGRGLIEED